MTAHLKLNRLTVYRSGRALYDERYHAGVNIIHGDNGSGKSTIADFIFYVLGGDLKEWREFAGLAEFVAAEISAGDNVITLRRDVSQDGLRPMHFHFGSLDEAMAAGPSRWQVAPYKRPEKSSLSFSQILFRAMGVPETISDSSSNITMHQILRILYSDQMTPVQRIFRSENFDTWQIRQAVGNLLCGIGGYDLYDRQLTLRSQQREFDEIAVRLRNLQTVAATYGKDILAEHILAAARNVAEERAKLGEKLEEALALEESGVSESALDEDKAKSRKDLGRARRLVAQLEDEIETLDYEIEDGASFLAHLRQSLLEFEDAAATFFSIGVARFEFCPSCFSTVAEKGMAGKCDLCGSDMHFDRKDTKNLAVRLDLEMQLRESSELQEERETRMRSLQAQARTARAQLRRLTETDEIVRRSADSARDALMTELSRKMGFLDRELESLKQREELAKEIANLSDLKAQKNELIVRLKDEIQAIEVAQEKRKAKAYTAISDTAKYFLEHDMKSQSDFGDILQVSFDFAGDWVAVNGDKNRAGSASGMVVLKNSFSMAMFLSSLEDNLFYLPRFMLLDNIEDKGMIQERSWNFQELIVAECAKRKTEHQVIFTTSKISPQLENSPHVVGRKYTRANPCLNFAKIES
jgi:hypothetical protein